MAALGVLGTIEPIVARYVDALGQCIRPLQVYVFGSYASGTPHEWSDIDVAVVSEDFSGDSLEDDLVLMDVAQTVDIRIEPQAFRPEDFDDVNPLVAQIMITGIRIA